MVAEAVKQPTKQPMTIPSVMQGLIETEDGKVFELDSPKGATWLETLSSFRYEPTGDGKPYTVRKEANAYWYGCRKVAGKVRKKYIGKSSEVSVAKLEEIAEALEIPTEPRAKQVAEVAEEVAQVAQFPQVAEAVAESRVTALELQVGELLKAVKALQEELPGKSELGDSLELPKGDNEVIERLQNELGNLKAKNELLRQELESTKLQLESHPATTSGHLYQEIENLKERNRLLLIKSREERQKLQEEISALKYRDESQSRRLQEKQARIDELEVQAEESRAYAALLESSTHVTNKLREEVQELRSQLAIERVDREEPAPKLDKGHLLNSLNGFLKKYPKSNLTYAQMKVLLEMIK